MVWAKATKDKLLPKLWFGLWSFPKAKPNMLYNLLLNIVFLFGIILVISNNSAAKVVRNTKNQPQ